MSNPWHHNFNGSVLAEKTRIVAECFSMVCLRAHFFTEEVRQEIVFFGVSIRSLCICVEGKHALRH